MVLSDLQRKDVINIIDGKKIGDIVDVKIDPSGGSIVSLIVTYNKGLGKFFASKDEIEITWTQIVKFGEDVILVKL